MGSMSIGRRYRFSRGFLRDDSWVPDGSDVVPAGVDQVHVTGLDDISPIHVIKPLDGQSCSMCWLGYTHSDDYHNLRVS